ncbi:hypothetical protein P3W55_13375 [Pseudomonas citronellolis]|uniref:Uncharacterized protein n=1 Tax=Pseudomonas citronellolis TaxID=53408 RepID=A0AAW6P648_9PSED|nr:hypothetical protein [Pseudomonas citronellolis]MDF3842701.1 hypothetical protein [Pseudomonas citronellolis]
MTTNTQQLPQAWLDVQAERRRQVEVENWSTEHDDRHPAGELAAAGSAYALYASDELCPTSRGRVDYGSLAPFMWPFNIAWWKRSAPRRALVKAAALILAEIERLDRTATPAQEGDLAQAETGLAREQAALTAKVAKAFPIGTTVVVVDGAGRRTPCIVKYHCTGGSAGEMRCLPVNNRDRHRSMRSVHWTQIEREGNDHA